MKVLGIDSSGLVASVAVVEDDILLAEYTVNYKKTHSQTLLPMLKEIGDMINLDLNSLDAIAIAAGPGSGLPQNVGGSDENSVFVCSGTYEQTACICGCSSWSTVLCTGTSRKCNGT